MKNVENARQRTASIRGDPGQCAKHMLPSSAKERARGCSLTHIWNEFGGNPVCNRIRTRRRLKNTLHATNSMCILYSKEANAIFTVVYTTGSSSLKPGTALVFIENSQQDHDSTYVGDAQRISERFKNTKNEIKSRVKIDFI